jgi:hypothetical protein
LTSEHVRLLDLLGSEQTLRGTDDVLAMTLPLLEQVVEVHERGGVAPLEGIDDLRVTEGRLWFELSKARAARFAPDQLERLQRPQARAFDIASNTKRVDDDGEHTVTDLGIVEPGEKLERPSFMTRYVSWEHEVGHHDPLTDIYVLGLVLASVALDQNLGEVSALANFSKQRANLLAANRRLHPVLVRAIVRMTELERHRRAQDLRALLLTLRNYREQTVTLDEPAPGAGTGSDRARRHVYGRLRDRLFDFSRRNRLLYFSPSGQTVNLTVGSVPLVLDVKNVAPDALLTWKGRAAEDITSLKAVPLGRYLRFEDYPFLSSSLDQLRLDANRSKNELGFSPLRLAVCFLHWHNLKEDKDVRITSPLLLLPVTLEKKKGVRDSVFLTADSDDAQVNPVLRQFLQQLYGVRLPETVDLADPAALDAMLTDLARQVQASEPGVTVTRVDKPRIDLVLAQAKRRLEAFRKRVALSGRTARSHGGFDYSYARARLHPLGVQLFTHLVYPSAAPNREMHDDPRPRIFQHSPEVVEKSLYSLKEGGTGGGPYEWALDFCNVTLANFNSRKMSLVRDYASLIDADGSHPSFDALFSQDARPVLDPPTPLPVEERFDVMPADPTQASAVARARRGESFIIQGPPGTGKSQTITNLLADAAARGKRVLFVCEKRAAIDVVFHRLRMQGLAPLTCLIHDSQADKKTFIKDLKETYEGWLGRGPSRELDDARRAAAAGFGTLLGRASRFRSAMQAVPPEADQSIVALIGRALELQDVTASKVAPERLPGQRAFAAAAPVARSLEQALRAVGRDAAFAKHPLRVLGDEVLFSADPEAAVRNETNHALSTLERLANSQLSRAAGVPRVGQLLARMRLIETLKPLILEKALRLLDPAGSARAAFNTLMAELEALRAAAKQAAAAAAGWRTPLAADEVTTALARARRFEGSWFPRLFGWLSPSWWQLRRVLNTSFDFASRAVRPAWTEVLERLASRYGAEGAALAAREQGQKALGVQDLDGVGSALASPPPAAGDLASFRGWLTSPGAADDAASMLRTVEESAGFDARLARLLRGVQNCAPQDLRATLTGLAAGLGDLPALLEPLRRLAAAEHRVVAELVREFPVSVDQLERDVCRASADRGLREHALDVLAGGDWDALRDETLRAGETLRHANADAIVERVRNTFLEHVARSVAPAETLAAPQKKLKREYASGRKELEHEFGKTTRYRSIRDLATGAPGVVVRDLKPIWLMSPLSVADTLPLEPTFDVVIFDEASQIPLEDAVPAAHRAAQTIVVGDEMQLPPTDFFGSGRGDSEDGERAEEAGYELDAQSLLTHATRALPSTMLGWHYRSRDEALIAFSNRVFYEGKLLTVPSVTSATERAPIVARAAQDGVAGAAAVLERSVSFHRLEDSPYEQRRNPGEARYIAELLRELLSKNDGKTVGVVAFSEAQQAEIESAIATLGEDDGAFAARYEAELGREEDGQHVGLFVKNLENVQGDERDIIIISVCYAPDARGKMLMNFGPINKTGGEKRLNVIFSRAKHHLAVVSSIRWPAITNDYNDGANCLRNYLRYAEAMSVGAVGEANLALQAYGVRAQASGFRGANSLDSRLAQALRARGYEVDVGVGTSRFRCNLGVRRRGEHRYRLGVLIDDAEQQARPVEEVLHTQASVLRGFGWKTVTVLHRDWYGGPALVVQRIEAALAEADSAEQSATCAARAGPARLR